MFSGLLSASAFYNTAYTSLHFAQGTQIRTIGSNAFENCTRLATVELPEGLTTIGHRAFNAAGAVPVAMLDYGNPSYGVTNAPWSRHNKLFVENVIIGNNIEERMIVPHSTPKNKGITKRLSLCFFLEKIRKKCYL